MHRASFRRTAACLPLLAVALAGCGSSSAGPAGEDSVAGVQAAGQQFAANLASGHFSEACEAFTATALATLNREPGGCKGVIAGFYLQLNRELELFLNKKLPSIQVQGNTATSQGTVEARYEHGRWHLENSIW